MMNLLAIDTSTARASVALRVKGVITVCEVDEVAEHARGILSLIDELLTQARITTAQLDGIVFGQGPGSFTGLRIACSVAKGLAYAHDLPLYPVSGLAAIAYHMRTEIPVLAVLDARMQQVYWAVYRTEYPAVEAVSAAADIVVSGDEHFIIAGVGWESYAEGLPLLLQKRVRAYYPQHPSASDLLALVDTGTITPVSVAEAQPVYIRNQVTQGAR